MKEWEKREDRMKNVSGVSLIAFALAVAGLAYSETVEPLTGAPAITFDASEVDLGPVHVGQIATAGFTFASSGTADLVIEKTDSSCGCVIPEQVLRAYKPGEQGEIRVQFDPAQAGTTGRVKKDIVVHSNDQSNPQHVLSVRAFIYTIKDGVPYEPTALQFGDVPVTTSKTMTVTIYEDSSGQLDVSRMEAPKGFRCAIEKADGNEGVKWFAKLSNEPTATIGPVSGVLKVHTNNKVQPVLEIPISLNTLGEIAVAPSRLFFGSNARGTETQKTIHLSSSGKPFKILGVSTDLPFVHLRKETKGARTEHTLTAVVRKDAPAGRFEGTITIQTDNQYEAEIRIPIFGAVSQ